ncbi:MAG: prepilin-type N-terminal cleavage/methylation domain-containing protein [Microgenomates group bacterium]
MKKAFTLVEILVVVTIISLLASVAAVSYSQFVKQSRDTKRRTDIEQIRAAVELYRNFDANGEYPASVTFGTGEIKDASATYLSTVPNDPLSSQTYTYYYGSLSANKDYLICAYLEGGGTMTSPPSCGPSPCNYCMGPYGKKQ